MSRARSTLEPGADVDALNSLLASTEPAIRFLARRDLLDSRDAPDPAEILGGPKVRALLAGQGAKGGFGVHPYSKWTGAHWRLVSLVELAVPAGEPRALAAADTVLDWLTGQAHRRGIATVAGLTRRCASQEGNALAVACRLGLAGDERARVLAESLVEWQWPDGGWNCDVRASGRRSSFHETLPPAWGLHEYWLATGDAAARDAAARAAELFLSHRLYRKGGSDGPIKPAWLALRYPPYWHYDILQGALILGRLGHGRDGRLDDALDVIEGKRLPDGTWRPNGYWWRPEEGKPGMRDVVDWGRNGSSDMLTLNALRVLRAAGRSAG